MSRLIFHLALKSWRGRKATVILSIISITLSVTLFLVIEQINRNVKDSFAASINDLDMVVGSRNSPFSILSATVLGMGFLRNQIDYSSYEKYSKNKLVKEAIPFSLGDNHQGFRVIGTLPKYFSNSYRKKSKLYFGVNALSDRSPLSKTFDVVLGSKVAKQLNYKLNQKINLSHGSHKDSAYKHQNLQFIVVGILKPTYTSTDSYLFVSLNAIEAIHHGWEKGAPPVEQMTINQEQKFFVKKISGFFLFMQNRISVLRLKYAINNDKIEPLTAVLPLQEMSRLWHQLGSIEKALKVISVLVLFIALLSILISSFSTLQYRKNEMALLRAIGTSPQGIFFLFLVENMLISTLSLIFALGFVFFGITMLSSSISTLLELPFVYKLLGQVELVYIGVYLLVSLVASGLPAIMASRQAILDRLTTRS